LYAVWCDLLKRQDVSIDDNFFVLGGHSLLVIQMMSAIKKKLSVALPIRTIFDAPTIRLLSRRVLEQIAQKKVSARMKLQTVVCLREGDPSEAPLFLVHPIGGTVFCYWPLLTSLHSNYPVYAIQDPGIDAKGPLFPSIASMASHYIGLIRQLQPVGPYRLAGYSFGGFVVVDMAKQLQEKGQDVEFLGVIDAWARYTETFNSMDRLNVSTERQYRLLKARLQEFDIEHPKRWLHHMYDRLQLNLRYQVPVINSPLVLFKATELYPEYAGMQDDTNHWQKYCGQLVKHHLIPGNHDTMMLSPQVSVLAQHLDSYLMKSRLFTEGLPDDHVPTECQA
jgi:thioesterase domain-containing protein/acyl carrier protein